MAAVPFFSAEAVNSEVDLAGVIGRVLDRNWYVMGEEVKAFEAEFAAYVGSTDCITVANGTDALELALRSVGVRRDSEVICAPNAGFYGSTACHAVGARPIYVDVDRESLCFSAPALQAAITARTSAVIVTHLYGQAADVARIERLCRDAGVPLVEDCAQAHGARVSGSRVGAFGDVGCFSFYPTKNLGALGDGGAVVSSNGAYASRLRALRQYGWSRKYVVESPGGRNSRLDEIQAAVLRAKLPLLDTQNEERRSIARRYNEAFAGLPLKLPSSLGEDYVAHLYVVRSGRRDAMREYLADAGIGVDVHYPIPDHLQPVSPAGGRTSLPVAEAACREVISLPCFPGMRADQVQSVIDAVLSFHSG